MQNTELCTVTLHVSSQEVWGGETERQGTSMGQAASSSPLFEQDREKRRKKEKKKEKNLPAESRPSFSHYCGSLGVV